MCVLSSCLVIKHPYIGFVGRPHPEDIRKTPSGRLPEITGEGENSSAKLIWGIYA